MEGFNNLYADSRLTSVSPMYGSTINANTFPMKADSAHFIDASRKRSREDNGLNFNHFIPYAELELDRLITNQNEKVRLEVESLHKRLSRRMIAVIEESMTMKLKAKDEELQKMEKLHWALEERVKSLSVDNQIWRELAQSSEATANALRINLEQVLAEMDEDVQSCCGSNYEEGRMLAGKAVDVSGVNGVDGSGGYRGRENSGVCRSCGKEEACVLLLPCRHLCLCAVCGASVHICPICNSIHNCSLLVNM